MRLNDREDRTLRAGLSELRASDDGGKKIGGYAALFGVTSDDLYFGEETIEPGAFTKTLQEADVRALWNHDTNFVLGRNKAKTLTLREDDKGLFYEAKTPNTGWAKDLVVSIDRGDVTQSSFGFRTIRDEWHQVDDINTRRILEVELFDVSPVTFPAYPQTDVAVRSLLRHEGAKDEEIEGLSEKLAELRNPQLTATEFRSIVDPITREFRERREADTRKPSTETQRLALDLLEAEL
jgi:hypothetical protein